MYIHHISSNIYVIYKHNPNLYTNTKPLYKAKRGLTNMAPPEPSLLLLEAPQKEDPGRLEAFFNFDVQLAHRGRGRHCFAQEIYPLPFKLSTASLIICSIGMNCKPKSISFLDPSLVLSNPG